jgi:ribonuclease BN (tRNA processing enzyme)
VIWPDFTRLPSPEAPVLAFVPFGVGDVLELAGRRLEVLPASHTVPAVGFAVWRSADSPARAWVFTGDTGPHAELWERLRSIDIRSLVIETAFRDEEQDLAERSAHLHPARLMIELAQLVRPTDVYITHIKPGEVDAVMSEISAHTTPHRLRALVAGDVLRLGYED